MDVLAYDYLYEGLVDFNAKRGKPRGNVILRLPTKSTYPHTVVTEIRNVGTNYNSPFDRLASVGYSVRIYAKNKGQIDKQTVAREVAKVVDEYFSAFNLSRVSFNANESINDDSIYEIIMTYSGNLHENRRNFI